MSTVAVIPLKALSNAKGRLATSIGPAERRKLVAWMLGRVVTACVQARGIDRVLVIAGDDEAAALASTHAGVDVVIVTTPGLSAAMAAADRHIADASTALVVAADLPDVTSADVEALLAGAGTSERAVVLARTTDGGTGALLRRPPNVITTAFGPGSAETHMSLARAAGIRPRRVDRPGLSHDVDTPEQLASLMRDVVASPPA